VKAFSEEASPTGPDQNLVRGNDRLRRGFMAPAAPAAQAETPLKQDPTADRLFVFRGWRGDLIKIIRSDGQGACLLGKRLEKGRLIWPSAKDGKIALTAAQLAMLPEG
jgi:transposase